MIHIYPYLRQPYSQTSASNTGSMWTKRENHSTRLQNKKNSRESAISRKL